MEFRVRLLRMHTVLARRPDGMTIAEIARATGLPVYHFRPQLEAAVRDGLVSVARATSGRTRPYIYTLISR